MASPAATSGSEMPLDVPPPRTSCFGLPASFLSSRCIGFGLSLWPRPNI